MGKEFKGNERIGEERLNNQGCPMKIVEYIDCCNIIVEFKDKFKTRVHTDYRHFSDGSVRNIPPRINEEKYNNQGCLMKIVEYNKANDIIVEFQDKFKARVHTSYQCFKNGNVKNPYYQSVYGVGMVGYKYPMCVNGIITREYKTWNHMLERCFCTKTKERHPEYKDITCCDEWLLFEKFYEWLHSQKNYERWLNGNKWNLDKDILAKGNKVYSPETCCLVPNNINVLFTNRKNYRGDLPIGVKRNSKGFMARCMNPLYNKREYIGTYQTPEEAFYAYKQYKEELIKQIAQIEYNKGNITKECYNAMMNYEIEITD